MLKEGIVHDTLIREKLVVSNRPFRFRRPQHVARSNIGSYVFEFLALSESPNKESAQPPPPRSIVPEEAAPSWHTSSYVAPSYPRVV